MTKVFAVTHTFAPAVNAEAIQATRTLAHLAAKGHEVTVFTSVPRSPTPAPSVRMDAAASLAESDIRRFKGREFSLLVRAAARILPWTAHVPDRHIGWRFTVRSAALRALRHAQPDVLYSRAQPFTSHLLAGWLHRRTDIPWVAHFSDPWLGNPYMPGGGIARRLNASLERGVVEASSALVVTNRQTKEMFAKRYGPEVEGRIAVIPHSFAGLLADLPPARRESGFLLAHVGSLYALRTPGGLLEALRMLAASSELPEGFRLVFAGPVDRPHERAICRSGVKDCIEITGPISYEESCGWMASADALLAIDAPSRTPGPFLPSKLVEYLAAGRPILALTSPGSATHDFIEQVGGLTAAADRPDAVVAALRRLFAAGESGLAGLRPRPEATLGYRVEATTAQLEALLSNVLEEGR